MQLQKEKQAVRQRSKTAANLKTRVLMAVLMVLALLILLLSRGLAVFFAVLVITLIAQRELLKAFSDKGVVPYRAPVLFAGIICCSAVYFLGTASGVAAILLSIFIMIISGLVSQEGGMDKTIYSCFIVLYPTLCSMSILALERESFEFLLGGIFAAIGCDTMGFFVGRAFGKRKLSPRLSPNKTVEGAVAGLFGGVFILAIAKYVFGAINFSVSFQLFGADITWTIAKIHLSWLMVVFCGFFGAAVSIVGDLFASSIKRYCGIKDFSSLIPGHGGVLDRLDGVFFSCAAMYFVYFIISIL
ncbi:MAG: phosphatidate cytidylyltransferase [Christensenellales bacterium]|jgi:phosphatidate cytidylyltransferase